MCASLGYFFIPAITNSNIFFYQINEYDCATVIHQCVMFRLKTFCLGLMVSNFQSLYESLISKRVSYEKARLGLIFLSFPALSLSLVVVNWVIDIDDIAGDYYGLMKAF